MIVRRADPVGPIAWECSSCGDAGHISGWEGTPYDLSGRRPHPIGGGQLIRVTDQVAQVLRNSDCWTRTANVWCTGHVAWTMTSSC